MNQIVRQTASRIGIDKAIFYTAASRMVQAIGGVISILFVVRYLTGVEQGFYYTFGSIVAIQVFFELGLNGIITQYVAHEASNLSWRGDFLEGDPKYRSRLSSLLRFSIRWYLVFAGLLIVTLLIAGIIFFTRYGRSESAVMWEMPWILLAVGTGLSLLVSPVIAFLEGLGKVKEMAKIRLIQQTVTYAIVWGGLILGARLFVSGISLLVGTLLILTILAVGRYKTILMGIWSCRVTEKVLYRKEIFPYQWKIAISWISGYFITQLFNPVLFATEGAVVAGQMGMTLTVLNGVLSLSLAWITTKVPMFSGLIAQKDYQKLDSIFNRTLKQSVVINFLALVVMGMAVMIVRHYDIHLDGRALGDRFLNYLPMILMMIPVFLNQFVSSWATYLRCHKREPFLINSMVGGILCSLSTVFLGKLYGVMGVTCGYFLISVLMFPWGYYIFRSKKTEWHQDPVEKIIKSPDPIQ